MNKIPSGLEDLFSTLRSQGWSDDDIYSSLNIPHTSQNGQRAKDRFKSFSGQNTNSNNSVPAPTGKTKGRFFKEGGAFDKNSGGGIGNFISTIGSPELDYNWKPVVDPTTGKRTTGLQAWGKNIGGAYNIGNIALQSYKAAQGLGDISDARKASKDVASDIVLSAANSPTIGYDLNADQKELLRELQRGTYKSNLNLGDVDLLGALGGGVKGALSGAPGGLPGVIIGGIGGLTNSVIGDLGDSAARDNAELEALYQAVLESEQYHNQMRKQRAYSALY